MSFNPFDELNTRLERIETLLINDPTSERINLARVIEKPITTSELCEFLGITEPTLIRLKKKRKIPFLQIGGSIRYDKAAVIKALENSSKK